VIRTRGRGKDFGGEEKSQIRKKFGLRQNRKDVQRGIAISKGMTELGLQHPKKGRVEAKEAMRVGV